MTFAELWRHFHGDLPPIGWRLRGGLNWVRFHSLPASKRYPDTDEEVRELLRRQNAIAGRMLGPEGSCWLVCSLCELDSDVSERKKTLTRKFGLGMQWSFHDPDLEGRIDVYAARVQWQEGRFDAELVDIANEEIRALWMSDLTGAVFAPYDGGVDCMLPTPEAMLDLRQMYRSWLSQDPLGL